MGLLDIFWRAAPPVEVMELTAPVLTLQDRADSFVNLDTGMGTSVDKGATTFVNLHRRRVSQEEIRVLYRYNPLVKRIIDIYPTEAVKEGWTISGSGLTTEQISLIEEEASRLKIRDVMRRAGVVSRKTGAALVLIVAEEEGIDDLAEPLRADNIRCISALQVFEFDEFEAGHEFDIDLRSQNYGRPLYWNIQPILSTGLGRLGRVHHSRCLYIDGTDCGVRDRQTNNHKGESILQHIYDAVKTRGIVSQAAGTLAQELNVRAIKVHELSERSAEDTRRNMITRLQTAMRTLNNHRSVLLDEKDSMEQFNGASAGYGELSRETMYQVGIAAAVPVTILFGMAPAGLSIEDAASRKRFASSVKSWQEEKFDGPLKRLYRMILASTEGPTNGQVVRFTITYLPTYSPTDKEIADTRKVYADMDAVNIQSGVYTPDRAAMRYSGGGNLSSLPEIEGDEPIDEADIETMLRMIETETSNERGDSDSPNPLPKKAKDNYRNGLDRHKNGETGSGMEQATVRMARKFAGGQTPSRQWVAKAARWWGRNTRFLDEPVGSPAYASAQLWGGRAGRAYYRSEAKRLGLFEDKDE